jgi:hypothetical protein
MRRALVVGIDYYEHVRRLYGCVSDSTEVAEMLELNGDAEQTGNFEVKHLTAKDQKHGIDRETLRTAIEDLFRRDGQVSLFYFAGHGHIEPTGGYLCSSDAKSGNDGIALAEIMQMANDSPAKNRLIVLDSCHSGVAGGSAINRKVSEIADGVTILTASTAEQYAIEGGDGGVFTNLFVDALRGGAANLTGDITPGSVYAHVDQSLGGFAQRPVFKTNVNQFVSLRKVKPPLALSELRRISEFFPTAESRFQLDPTYEPERAEASGDDIPTPVPMHTDVFAILQKYNRVGLVIPDAPHMWHAAMQSKTVRLTPLGKHYHRLAIKKLIGRVN